MLTIKKSTDSNTVYINGLPCGAVYYVRIHGDRFQIVNKSSQFIDYDYSYKEVIIEGVQVTDLESAIKAVIELNKWVGLGFKSGGGAAPTPTPNLDAVLKSGNESTEDIILLDEQDDYDGWPKRTEIKPKSIIQESKGAENEYRRYAICSGMDMNEDLLMNDSRGGIEGDYVSELEDVSSGFVLNHLGLKGMDRQYDKNDRHWVELCFSADPHGYPGLYLNGKPALTADVNQPISEEDADEMRKKLNIDGSGPVTRNEILIDTSTNAGTIILDIPEYTELKHGDTFLIRKNVASTAVTNVVINELPPVRLFGNGANNASTGYVGALALVRIIYDSNINAFSIVDYVSKTILSGTADNAITASSVEYGLNSKAVTYVSDKTSQLDKYLPIGTFSTQHNAGLLDGKFTNIYIRLHEMKRGANASVDVEDFQINVVMAGKNYSGSEWLTYLLDAKVTVKGTMIDTKPEDIVLIQTSNSSLTKVWTLYVKAHVADKIFNIIPNGQLGFVFSTTSWSQSTSNGSIVFTYINNGTPVATLPTPVQGVIVTAVKTD